VLIKPLPYSDADELVRIRYSAPGIDLDDLPASPSMYLTYRDENRTFSSIGVWQESDATLSDRGEPERVRALRVSHGTLQALGVQPMRGRWFTEQEHGPAAQGPEPVILSYAFWQRQFSGDAAVLGRDLSIDGQPSQVVGIMPADFGFLDTTPRPDVILAVRLDPATQILGAFGYQMLARLQPDVPPSEARADIERMLPIWIDSWATPDTRAGVENMRITPAVRLLQDDIVGGVASMLWVLMSAIGAV
jgi:hypothetical protein